MKTAEQWSKELGTYYEHEHGSHAHYLKITPDEVRAIQSDAQPNSTGKVLLDAETMEKVSDTPTPRTDAVRMMWGFRDVVDANFARTIERELAEKVREIERLKEQRDIDVARACEVTQRDADRENARLRKELEDSLPIINEVLNQFYPSRHPDGDAAVESRQKLFALRDKWEAMKQAK